MSSMRSIRYEMHVVVSDVGGESNTSDEATYVKLVHSHEQYLCHTFIALRPHDGEHISIQLMYRT